MTKRVYTITAQLHAYGPTTSIGGLNKIFTRLLKEEHPDKSADDIAALSTEIPAADARDIIAKDMFGIDDELPKAGAKHSGIHINLPDLNERFLTMELMDMRIAKTCTVLLRWKSENDDLNHQVTWLKGAQESKDR